MPLVVQRALRDVIYEAKEGALRIPYFQRDFVWTKPQVRDFLDSIRKEMSNNIHFPALRRHPDPRRGDMLESPLTTE